MKYPFIFISATIIISCGTKKEEPSPTNITTTAVTEYIAKDTSFLNYKSWKVVLVQDSALSSDGRAHSNAPRITWIKQSTAVRGSNGQYPLGTVLVKSVSGGYGIVAMAKRNGDFNKSNNGWEWFKLNEEGKISIKYISPGGCDDCHKKVAVNQDYVFTRK
ncbi:MAG: hypothetical protein SFY32_00175 [Bacteroidota bacterium]|nr:hypothetical protein [Bacteroidota bacterium]